MAAIVVLLIEDTDDHREMYALALNSRGIATLTAPDGTEGLRLAEEAQPDVIVLDLGLPQIDGLEVARRLKENPATQRIPVLVVSAHAMPSDRAAAEKLGIECFLSKPCAPDVLVEEVRRCLRI
jgi:two-component system, cell cycle response regulator DivK